MNKLTEQQVKNWLENYGKAWETSDVKILELLFSKNALYYETPFQKPLRGIKEIQEYWKAEGCVWADVKFTTKRFWFFNSFFFAEWICRLKRASTKTDVKMSGVFLCEAKNDKVKNFKEFWHIR